MIGGGGRGLGVRGVRGDGWVGWRAAGLGVGGVAGGRGIGGVEGG